MRLDSFISDLLYRYDCVTIPELGAFVTNKVSAKIHSSTNSFYPPKKVLTFNEQIKNNDGLLANYLAEVEKIPYEVAAHKIERQVKEIKSFLTQGEVIVLQHIGELKLNSEGRILFEPSQHVNYLTDAFGLAQFTSADIKREVYKAEVEAIEKVIPIAVSTEKRRSRSYLKYAAIAVLGLAVAGAVYTHQYVNNIEEHNVAAQEQAHEQVDKKVQEATFVISNPLPVATLTLNKQSGNYHIVAGAFRVEENSDKKVQQLIEAGFKARKIGVNKYGLHEVVYGSYSDRIEALNTLRSIRATHNKEAWLLVKQLD
ncbi:SPOR domain-containing protein [Paucihalobacter sp.]|uniref:HU domain-containing protein n=2 Tax=Paucihalobacter sp. TaxID=2850405 RepID=UPI003D160E13